MAHSLAGMLASRREFDKEEITATMSCLKPLMEECNVVRLDP
jgi:hypothetical protein